MLRFAPWAPTVPSFICFSALLYHCKIIICNIFWSLFIAHIHIWILWLGEEVTLGLTGKTLRKSVHRRRVNEEKMKDPVINPYIYTRASFKISLWRLFLEKVLRISYIENFPENDRDCNKHWKSVSLLIYLSFKNLLVKSTWWPIKLLQVRFLQILHGWSVFQ